MGCLLLPTPTFPSHEHEPRCHFVNDPRTEHTKGLCLAYDLAAYVMWSRVDQFILPALLVRA